MEVCPSTVLNSDASENVAYNNPDFPAYVKKGQLSSYPDFRAVSHWHDDLEFILILDGQMFYDVNGQRILLQTAAAFIMAIPMHIQNVSLSVFFYPHYYFL